MASFLIHTQYYPPEIGAPQARLSELAIGLQRRGFDVQILTAMPNYPTGKLFKGYGGCRKQEKRDGVAITRTWVYATKKISFIPRLFNYFSFVFSSLFLGPWGLGKIDYLLAESPPLFLGISSFLLSRIKGAKWIFNVSDLWPESAIRLGVLNEGLLLRLAQWLEGFFYRHAGLITGQSESILQNIKDRYPNVNTYHLSNGIDVDKFGPENLQPSLREELAPNGELIFFYGGLHGLAQGLDQILYAAQQAPPGIRFVLMGDGPEKEQLIQLADQLKLSNLTFHESVESHKMPAILASVDVCLVPLKVNLPGAVPSKLYEAMASAKPVVLIAEGEAREIVETNQVGLVVNPGDIPGITRAIELLIEDPGLRKKLGGNGRKTALEQYSRENIVQKFAEYLKKSQN
jgi:glycosyltransferase involved in cell wall biosynthesis